MLFFLIECKDVLNGIMFEHLFLIKTEESKNKAISLAVLCKKKDDYLSDADADPRIMKNLVLSWNYDFEIIKTDNKNCCYSCFCYKIAKFLKLVFYIFIKSLFFH